MADFSPIMLARFWGRVSAARYDVCWPWTGAKNDKGYGRFNGGMAHRIAYELIHGPIPEGLILRHKCDNPPCCNPDHLEIGTHRDNTQDSLDRERFAKGERHGNTKLRAEQVDTIRRNPERKTGRALAAEFGVSPATISYIRSGRSWK